MFDITIDIDSFGQGDSFIHKIHPAVKVVVSFFIMGACTIIDAPLFALILAIFCVALILAAGVSIKRLIKAYLMILYFIVFMIIIYSFLLGPSIEQTLSIWASLTAVSMPSLLLIFTTPLLKMLYGIEFLLTPFKYLKLPVNAVILICTIALSFIPIVITEVQRILYSMAVRGDDIRYVSFTKKIKICMHALIPLLIATISRSETLASAISVKNYDSFKPRTNILTQKWIMSDSIFIILSFVFIIVSYQLIQIT